MTTNLCAFCARARRRAPLRPGASRHNEKAPREQHLVTQRASTPSRGVRRQHFQDVSRSATPQSDSRARPGVSCCYADGGSSAPGSGSAEALSHLPKQRGPGLLCRPSGSHHAHTVRFSSRNNTLLAAELGLKTRCAESQWYTGRNCSKTEQLRRLGWAGKASF